MHTHTVYVKETPRIESWEAKQQGDNINRVATSFYSGPLFLTGMGNICAPAVLIRRSRSREYQHYHLQDSAAEGQSDSFDGHILDRVYTPLNYTGRSALEL